MDARYKQSVKFIQTNVGVHQAFENDGWWGYVFEYPEGIHPGWKYKVKK